MKGKGLKGIINNVTKNMRVKLFGKLEVRVSMVLDKEDPADLDKAYILVATRDITSDDKRWRFAYRSKKGCIHMMPYQVVSYDYIIPRRIKKYKLCLKYGTDEFKRFRKFSLSGDINCLDLHKSLEETSVKATIKYFNMINRKDLALLV